IGEPEQLVLEERTSYRVSKLISAQFSFGRVEEITGIEIVIAEKLKCVAMESVAAGFRDRVHYAAAVFAVFRVEAVGNEPEFLNGIKVGNKAGALVSTLAYITAVD